jgi:hypothetical protein
VARLALTSLTLSVLLAACGGSDSTAQTQPQGARTPVRIYAPADGKLVDAQPFARRQLRAVIRASGSAAPGRQLTLRGACGGYSCEGITFADRAGRWRTRLELVTPRGKARVKLTVAYAQAGADERPAAVVLRLRRATTSPPPQASPQPAPPRGQTPSTGGASAPSGANPYTGTRTMIVIGDSLAIGMASPLRALLADWDVPVDGRTGRPLAEGMEILAETALPPGARGKRAILAFSLFTNDDPTNVEALDAAVRQSVARLGPHGCAVWATIARPPLGGVSYAAANDRLLALADAPELAGRLLIVPWKREYDRHPSWRREDGVHATSEGNAARAQLYADTARACAA